KSDLQRELFPLHSPLLGESWLVSFPPLSYMLKFSGGFVHEVRCTRSSRSGTRRVRPKRWPRPPPERGGRDNNKGRVVSTDTPTSMLPGISRKRKMRSKF
ncbi:unnamed protein product, partial [Ectocarpus fasciculatus]